MRERNRTDWNGLSWNVSAIFVGVQGESARTHPPFKSPIIVQFASEPILDNTPIWSTLNRMMQHANRNYTYTNSIWLGLSFALNSWFAYLVALGVGDVGRSISAIYSKLFRLSTKPKLEHSTGSIFCTRARTVSATVVMSDPNSKLSPLCCKWYKVALTQFNPCSTRYGHGCMVPYMPVLESPWNSLTHTHTQRERN